MKQGWEVKEFGQVCKIEGGNQPPKKHFIYEEKEGYIRLVQVRDYRTDKFVTYIPKELAKRFCCKTDIMIGRYGPPIFGIFRGIEGAYNVALMKAIPNEKYLNQDYLFWFLKNHKLVKYVEKTSKRAAGQDGIRKERLYAYPTPIPPLSEQKQIVKKLDAAFAAIDKAKENIERNIQNAQDLFQSKLNQFFSQKGDDWEENKFSNVFKLKSGENLTTKKMVPGKFPVYGGNGIAGFHNKFNRENGCILIGRVGALCGNCFYDPSSIWLTDNAFEVIYSKNTFNKLFLCNLLNFLNLRQYARQAAQPVISNSSLKDVLVSFPSSTTLQFKIASEIEKLSTATKKLEENYKIQLQSLEELKKSILEKAFQGELTQ